ncbi:MAG: TVP38/TMEM64 family protein [Planctomycetaceae bacterium]
MWRRLLVVGLVGIVGYAAFAQFGDQLSLSQLAAREGEFRAYQSEHPVLIYVAAFSIYVLVAGLSLPGATAMTLVMGWLFGLWRGILVVSFASTLGATLAFLLSRYLLRNAIQRRFGSRLEAFNQALEREGAFYLFTLRLIPAVPFFVINVVMGLTPLRLTTYWWVSQIGMLPGTAVYVYAGSNFKGGLRGMAEHGVAGILTTELLLSFVMLGLFPILVKKVFNRFRSVAVESVASGTDSQPPSQSTRTDAA